MSLVAYALKEALADDFVGGQIAYGPDARSFDVKEALDAGDGKIVIDTSEVPGQLLVAALDNYHGPSGTALKRVSVEGASPTVSFDQPDEAVASEPHIESAEGAEPDEDEGEGTADDEEAQHAENDSEYEALPEAELRDLVRERKLRVSPRAGKAELVKALEASDEEGRQ